MELVENDILLEDLADIENLSVRAFNICKDAELTTLRRILAFYSLKKSFKFIRNCGSGTDRELIEICEKYINKTHFFGTNGIKANTQLNQINELNPIQKSILNRHLEYHLSKLSVRSINGMRAISQSLDPKEIFDEIFKENFNFRKFKNIGVISFNELDKLRTEISNFLNKLTKIKSDLLSKEYAKIIIKTNIDNQLEGFDEKIEKVFDQNNKIKLFCLIELMLDSNQILKDNEKKIFRNLYCESTDIKSDYESIIIDLKLSRERIRQLKLKLESEIPNIFSFVSNFLSEDLVNYGIEKGKSFYLIDNSTTIRINSSENVSFNTTFYSVIFGLFLSKSHKVLGDDENLNGKRKTIYSKNYKNCYLIANEYFENFDFVKFIIDLNDKLADRIIESYSLHFEGYLCLFSKNDGLKFLNEIKPICEAIVFNEFDIVLNTDGYLELERNTTKQLQEYCYEILTSYSRPMSLDEIEDVFNTRHPNVKKTTDSIRGTLLREKDLFICFGRSSIYGLKKWENELENFKGGTIRQLVEEYLTGFEQPKHISEITEYIIKYRPDTGERSILTNLKVGNNKHFVFYKGDYIGLINKNYTLEETTFKRIVGSHFNSTVLKKINGYSWEKCVNYYVEKFGYNEIQVAFILKRKVKEGLLKLTTENKLFYE